MFLKSLSLCHFRNYQQQRFDFCPDINFIYGDNAQGKTSLLEAIYFLIIGRSFRTKHTKELIHFSKNYLALKATFEKGGLSHELKVLCNGSKRQVWLNNSICKSFFDIFGLLKGVVLYPEDYSLIAGPPALRRKFLDIQLAQSSSTYLKNFRRYQEALKQKNAALKLKNEKTLPLWEEQMAQLGSYLIIQRQACLEELQVIAKSLLEKISSSQESLSFHYHCLCPPKLSQDELALSLKELFTKYRVKELKMGCSLVGPHKDEIKIHINDQCAKTYGSEGQQRSLAACLRLAEWQFLKKNSPSPPLMIVDDMDISLDKQRKEKLLQQLDSLGQVFITSPYPPYKHSLKKKSQLLAISKGSLLKSSKGSLASS